MAETDDETGASRGEGEPRERAKRRSARAPREKKRRAPKRGREHIFDIEESEAGMESIHAEAFEAIDFEIEAEPEAVAQEESPLGPSRAEPEPEAEAVEPAGEGEPTEELGLPTARRRKPPARGRGRMEGIPTGTGTRLIVPLIIAAAAATLIINIIFTRLGQIDYSDFAFFLVVFAVCANFELKLKGGATLNLGLAPLLAALLALPAVVAVWVFFFGTLVTIIVKMLYSEVTKDDLLGILIDFTGVGIAAVVFHFFVKILPKTPELRGNYWPGLLVAIALGAGILFIIYVLEETYILSQEGQFPGAVYFQSVLRKYWLPFLAVGFLGVLSGLIFVGIGMWSMLLVIPLLPVLMYAYNHVAATDQYLLETIRTLAAIPEEAGRVPKHHSERVAIMAGAVARELGLSPEDIQQVEYAAYLHDIGVIGRDVEAREQQQLLEVDGVIAGGVDVVGKVEYLEVAAEILRGREGLRDRVVDVDKRRAVSMGSGILRAIDDFEALVEGREDREPLSETDALTEMNLERGVRYDSKVLRAIARVLPRLPKDESIAGGSTESSTFWREPEG